MATWQVAASADDVERYGATNCRTSNTVIYLGSPGVSIAGGFRFTNVTIPAGATILTAKITLTHYNALTGTGCNVRIRGQASNDTITFSDYVDYDARPQTSHYEDWAMPDMASDTEYDSPDLSPIVQEIIAISGWASGNSLVLFLNDNGSTNYRQPYAYDGNPAFAAKLTATWSTATTYTKALSLDSYLQKILTKTPSLDSYLQKTYVKTPGLDSVLQKLGLTGSSSIDAFLEKLSLLVSTSGDAFLSKSEIKNLGIDAFLFKILTKNIGIDAVLSKLSTLISLGLDSELQKIGLTKSSSIDAILEKLSLSKSISIDAWLKIISLPITLSMNAFLKKNILLSLPMDAILYALPKAGSDFRYEQLKLKDLPMNAEGSFSYKKDTLKGN